MSTRDNGTVEGNGNVPTDKADSAKQRDTGGETPNRGGEGQTPEA